MQVFAARGFYNARVSDIAREAGVADGTIYLYFKNKDDLLISLFEDRMDLILGAFSEALASTSTATDGLRRLVHLHLELVAQEPTLAEVLTVELRQSSKFMREYKAPKFSEYLTLWTGLIERGQRSGELRPDVDPKIVTLALFGALDEVSLHWVGAHRKPYELSAAADEIWKLCTAGLLAGGSPTTVTT